MEFIAGALFIVGAIYIIVKLWHHPEVLNKNPEDFNWGRGSFFSSEFGDDSCDGDSDGGCDGGDGGD